MTTLEDVSLRPATTLDWPEIADLLSASQLPQEGAQEHLQHYWVALAGRKVVGVAGMEAYGNVALLRSVAVASEVSGRGLGKRLVAAILALAQRQEVTQLYLLTTSAVQYFERCGFHRRSRDSVPAALKSSVEFQSACPASATLMELSVPAFQDDVRAESAPAGGAIHLPDEVVEGRSGSCCPLTQSPPRCSTR